MSSAINMDIPRQRRMLGNLKDSVARLIESYKGILQASKTQRSETSNTKVLQVGVHVDHLVSGCEDLLSLIAQIRSSLLFENTDAISSDFFEERKQLEEAIKLKKDNMEEILSKIDLDAFRFS